jgi:Glycosyl hydrolase catalytic core
MGDLSHMIFRPRRTLVCLAILASSLASAATDPRIGVMTHFAQGWPTSWADTATSDSLGSVRDELYWAQVESTPGVYSFPASFDAYMAKLKKDAIAPLIIMSFANPLYDGGNTPYTAAGIGAFANYGVAILNHYGSQVDALEVWNEFNGSFCSGPDVSDREAAYTAMLKVAYAQIKAVRPDVKVAGGATAGTPLPYWGKLIADGALPYMDVLSIHPYRFDTPPEGIENDIAALEALVKENNNGVSKPIWVTEIGWEEQTAPLLVDEPTLAKYVTRSYALLLSAGVERIYWYLLHDDYDQPMGLYKSTGAAKPAVAAMRTLVNEVAGAPFSAREATPDNVYSMMFQAAGGRQIRIMWSLSSRWVNLTGVTKALDLLGNSLGTSGNYQLSDAPIFIEGNVTGVPKRSASDEVILATSSSGFAGKQGENGWTYGYSQAAGPFLEMPTYTSNDWNYYWTANYSYLSVTAIDMHPSLNGTTPVNAIRRWTSNRAGPIHLVGNFQGETQGDGVGVSILIDGKPALARHLIGAKYPPAQVFDLVENVNVGSTVDFIVDVGPASDMSYDATNMSVQILTSDAAYSTAFPDTGSVQATESASPPAEGTVLADSLRDFGSKQGEGGWTYGDFLGEGSTIFDPAPLFLMNSWQGGSAAISISATGQRPAVAPTGGPAIAVRRWTSSYSGDIHVTGAFSDSKYAENVEVSVLLNGAPVIATTAIGSSAGSLVKTFDFHSTVSAGDTIDFTVDPGPAMTITGQSPTMWATIALP